MWFYFIVALVLCAMLQFILLRHLFYFIEHGTKPLLSAVLCLYVVVAVTGRRTRFIRRPLAAATLISISIIIIIIIISSSSSINNRVQGDRLIAASLVSIRRLLLYTMVTVFAATGPRLQYLWRIYGSFICLFTFCREII